MNLSKIMANLGGPKTCKLLMLMIQSDPFSYIMLKSGQIVSKIKNSEDLLLKFNEYGARIEQSLNLQSFLGLLP